MQLEAELERFIKTKVRPEQEASEVSGRSGPPGPRSEDDPPSVTKARTTSRGSSTISSNAEGKNDFRSMDKHSGKDLNRENKAQNGTAHEDPSGSGSENKVATHEKIAEKEKVSMRLELVSADSLPLEDGRMIQCKLR